MNAVDICNLALGYVGEGASKPIEALTEVGESARACRRVYASTLEQLLRAWRWPFAMKSAALAVPADVSVPGYAYVYTYPTDCLFLHSLGGEGMDPRRCEAMRVPFARVGAYIATDLPNAWAHYTFNVTTLDDPLFCEAFAWALAEKLALGLKADPRLAQYAMERARASLAVAQAAASNEVGHDADPLPENLRVRGSVVRGPWEAG